MQVARAFTAVRPARSTLTPTPQRVAVVVQAKPTKLSDFSGLSNQELVEQASLLKRELASVKWVQRSQGLTELKAGEAMPQRDPAKIPKAHVNKHLRRQIAQCLTLLRQRQIADGITDRREARRIEKRAALAQGTLQKSAAPK
ncbi:mitochondrial ribosomal protein L29 [Volvox carteri f. nagariensis]|uniref:Mitochondrial ribosomal protein L29 n=1 Tax=Volvox carteri f. nagariensis TaxID=3068 RepID=D8TI17_VOLCA|nr:mitochondrial ribosomal protein L29 [Volvox carteri f. nagariensis]EFJ53162.1 mitochondrial ribosomal protein L29 [Volvox carteri f. nagariensis]|eukprot:XP_002946167.1 mitochondrial ribosomal protein L29 [Volvox carteri f. nagariensis]